MSSSISVYWNHLNSNSCGNCWRLQKSALSFPTFQLSKKIIRKKFLSLLILKAILWVRIYNHDYSVLRLIVQLQSRWSQNDLQKRLCHQFFGMDVIDWSSWRRWKIWVWILCDPRSMERKNREKIRGWD